MIKRYENLENDLLNLIDSTPRSTLNLQLKIGETEQYKGINWKTVKNCLDRLKEKGKINSFETKTINKLTFWIKNE